MAKRSLRTHFLLLYVMLAVLGGIIVPLIGIRLSQYEFGSYLNRRQKYDLEEIGRTLLSLYREDNGWDRRRVMYTLRQLKGASGVSLFDADETKIFPPGSGRWRSSSDSENCISVDLRSGDVLVGVLVENTANTQGKFETDFIASLERHSLWGAFFIIIIACGLGFIVAGHLSRPILKTAKRTRRIAKGKYEMEQEIPTNIRELDELSEGVEFLGRSLLEQERLRKRLMTDVAHELRTPASVVKSQLEAMADGVLEPSPERMALCVAEIDRLSSLISEVEQIADLEGKNLTLQKEPKDIADFLGKTAESFRPLFDAAGIILTSGLETGVIANIDEGRFRHVIENLLSNALRYTPSGGTVRLRLYSRKNEFFIEVEDSGIGISPEDLPYIFDRFYRADASRSRNTGGRGVGLAIARAAAEAHGFKITVKSEPGKGSIFTVRGAASGSDDPAERRHTL